MAHGIVEPKTAGTVQFDDGDTFNYRCSLVEYLDLLKNLQHAVSEGDGGHIEGGHRCRGQGGLYILESFYFKHY